MSIDWARYGISAHSGASPEAVLAIQEKCSGPLPALYVGLLQHANGASPDVATFPFGDEETCVSDFFEASVEPSLFSVLWYARAGAVTGLPPNYLPIARDAGGLLVCLNFNRVPPSVEVFDSTAMRIHFVAPDFESFVGLWHE